MQYLDFDGLPDSILAGDTREFSWTNVDFSGDDGWVVVYYLHGTTSTTVSGSWDGTEWDFTIPASATANGGEETVAYSLVATSGSLRYTLAQGSIQQYADPATNKLGERLRNLEADLKAINNYISGVATDSYKVKSLGGLRLERMDPAQIQEVKEMLAEELYTLKFGKSASRRTLYIELG